MQDKVRLLYQDYKTTKLELNAFIQNMKNKEYCPTYYIQIKLYTIQII